MFYLFVSNLTKPTFSGGEKNHHHLAHCREGLPSCCDVVLLELSVVHKVLQRYSECCQELVQIIVLFLHPPTSTQSYTLVHFPYFVSAN